MQWEKFYKKWAADVGSFIGQDVVQSWQAFVADAEEAVLVKAIEEIAAWYNAKNQRSDGYVANVTLYQLRESYRKLYAEAHPGQLGNCAKCEGEGLVFIVDKGSWKDPDYPAERGEWLCVIPCPVCQAHKYGAYTALRKRVFDRCRPSSRRDELYSRQEVTA